MEWKASTVCLRDGTSCLLRTPRPKEDAAALLEMRRHTYRESEHLILFPDELEEEPEGQREYLHSRNRSPLDLLLTAWVGEEPVGMSQLSVDPRRKLRHRALVSIALRRKVWGLGLGAAMLREQLKAARALGCIQVELLVVEGNRRAMALYEKMGFVPCGRIPRAVRQGDGHYADEIRMICLLDKGDVGQ